MPCRLFPGCTRLKAHQKLHRNSVSQGGNHNEKGRLAYCIGVGGVCSASPANACRWCGYCERTPWVRASALEGTHGFPFLFGRAPFIRALVVSVLRQPLPPRTSCPGAFASGISPAGAATGRLLVLLPGSARVLPLRSTLPRWMDESGAGGTQAIEERWMP
jgi:hypothetical protein